MKLRIKFVVIFILISTVSIAQKEDVSQFFANPSLFNPAFSGMENYLDLKLGFRQRWSGFDDQNEQIYLNASGFIGPQTPTSFRGNSLRISKPEAYSEFDKLKNLRKRHGWGGIVFSQNFGAYSALEVGLNYAYHLPLSEELTLSFGTNISYNSQTIDFNQYQVRNSQDDDFYQRLLSSGGKRQVMDVDFGAVLYSKSFHFAVSSGNLVVQNLEANEFVSFNSNKNYNLMAGYKFAIGPYFELISGGRFDISEVYDARWSLYSKLEFKNTAYLGFAIDPDTKASMLIGLMNDGKFSIHYAYDYYLSDLNDFNAGNHEFILGIALGNRNKMTSSGW